MRKRSKRARKSKTVEQDRLSSLPDDTLTHILSFLTTKQSVSTSALSTRWKHLFKSVPALHFDSSEGCGGFLDVDSTFRFYEFVNNVLAAHSVKCIQSFRLLHSHSDNINRRFLRSWIDAAISRNPQLLEMKIETMRNFVPDDLLTCRRLVHLKLSGWFVLRVIGTVCLPALKTFYINGCTIRDGDSFRTLFSSCPVLEALTLYVRHPDPNVKFLAINVPSLKKLTICYPLYNPCVWELNVPNLEYISCNGVVTKWYSVTVLESLREACIDLEGCYPVVQFPDDRLMGLVNKFHEVQCLSLSGDSMQSLALSSSCSLPMFNKLTTLELKTKYLLGWRLFPTLLEKSPCLELLVIHEDGFMDHIRSSPEMSVLLHKHTIPLCFSQSLKVVKYCKFRGHEDEYQLFRYLLKNAMILEKLTVVLQYQPGSEFVKDIALAEKYSEIKRLYALPRSSNSCQVTVEGPNGEIVCQEGGGSSSPTSL